MSKGSLGGSSFPRSEAFMHDDDEEEDEEDLFDEDEVARLEALLSGGNWGQGHGSGPQRSASESRETTTPHMLGFDQSVDGTSPATSLSSRSPMESDPERKDVQRVHPSIRDVETRTVTPSMSSVGENNRPSDATRDQSSSMRGVDSRDLIDRVRIDAFAMTPAAADDSDEDGDELDEDELMRLDALLLGSSRPVSSRGTIASSSVSAVPAPSIPSSTTNLSQTYQKPSNSQKSILTSRKSESSSEELTMCDSDGGSGTEEVNIPIRS